ncbi:DUF4245 domain-containing protein [Nocardioides sp. KIGAM211]|uniref:DUF4245 domain-containing protein n=1 Tax=Nocardioides luti TaxID=2761101 RepID=A0A7X0RER7_9ACTN|nr:DUF4245 domain-containing protein [Nocardioides luti]
MSEPGPETEPTTPSADGASAPAGQRPGRYPRTTNGLIGALVVTLLVIGAFVALRALNRDDLEVKPTAVDYLGLVKDAQAGGVELVYPTDLPQGWIADSVQYVPGDRPAWGIGMLTDAGKYVGLRQEDVSVDDLLATYVDENATEGDPISVSGSVAPEWRSFSDEGGDHAYAAEVGEDTVLVYGSADVQDLRTVLDALSTDPR